MINRKKVVLLIGLMAAASVFIMVNTDTFSSPNKFDPNKINIDVFEEGTKEDCSFAKPDPEDFVVLISDFSSRIKANVRLGYPHRWEDTSSTELKIEPGDRPIFIIANSVMPRIWDFTGDTARVRKFIAIREPSRRAPLVGVAGLEEAKIDYVTNTICTRFSSGGRWTLEKFGEAIGHEIDLFPTRYAENYDGSVLALPSDGVTGGVQDQSLGPNNGLSRQVMANGKGALNLVHFDLRELNVPAGFRPARVLR